MKIIFCFTGLCLISFGSAAVINVRNADGSEDEEDIIPKDSMFADVIKNITRVNNVLQDLIKNYERLQKIYHSQETLENYSDDRDDRLHGVSENFRDGLKKKSANIQTSTTNLIFPATTMIGSQSAESNETNVKTKKRVPKIEPLIAAKEKGEKLNIIKKADNVTKEEKTKKDGNGENGSSDSNSVEIKFGDDSKKGPAGIVKFNIGRTSENMEKLEEHRVQITNTTLDVAKTIASTRSVVKKQIIQTEAFNPNKIWKDIGSNRQLQIKKEKEIIFNKRARNDSDFRRNPTKKIKHNKKKNKHQTNKTLTSASIETDNGIKKFQFQSMILRRAYGDACLKVVIRKCYKALCNVINNSCKSSKCQGEFKNTFKLHSRNGCIQEFDVSGGGDEATKQNNNTTTRQTRNTTNIENIRKVITNTNKRAQQANYDLFMDLTRNGYLSSVCLPEKPKDSKKRSGKYKQAERRIGENVRLTYLRDRFEEECKKASRLKCNNACVYAIEQTCTTLECKGDKRKNLLKGCKTQCKRAYSGSSKGSSDDSGDSDDSSGSSDSGSSSSSSIETTKHANKHTTKAFDMFPLRTEKNISKPILRQNKKSESRILLGNLNPIH